MYKIGAAWLVLVLMLFLVGKVSSQPAVLGQPGCLVETFYSRPAVLGDSMFMIVNVTNLAYYIVASVEEVVLTFDWGATLSGSTPRILEPGKTTIWSFDSVEVPSYVWSGLHACLISVEATFSYPAWPTERLLTYIPIEVQGEISLQFPVQAHSQSGASTMVAGPSLIKEVPIRGNSATQGTSLIYTVYRGVTIAVVAFAVILLVANPSLSKVLHNQKKS
jgi:hypothetical protein